MTADEIIDLLHLASHPKGAWTMVGCTVSPGFRFDGFDLAPEGFTIPAAERPAT